MIFKRALAAIAMLCVAALCAAPAHAQKNKAGLAAEINANWPDNTVGAITPASLRSTVIDIVNSYFDLNGGTSLSCAAHQWIAAFPTLSSITCTQPSISDLSTGTTGSGLIVLNSGPTFAGTILGIYTLGGTPTIASPVITGSFTATGLVTVADLASPSITINSTTCTLGSSCSITATAGSITFGTTGASGTPNAIVYTDGTFLQASTSPSGLTGLGFTSSGAISWAGQTFTISGNNGGIKVSKSATPIFQIIDQAPAATIAYIFGNASEQAFLPINNGSNGFVTLTSDSAGGGILDIGGGQTVGGKTGTINLGTLNASVAVNMPDGGSLAPTLNTLNAGFQMPANSNAVPLSSLAAGSFGYDPSSGAITWVASGVNNAITPPPYTSQDLNIADQNGDIVADIQGGTGEQDWGIGVGRFLNPLGTANGGFVSQNAYYDAAAVGVINTIGSLTGGTSCPNGTYADVATTDSGSGVGATLSITVSGGVATAATLTPLSRNYTLGHGGLYTTGDLVTVATTGSTPNHTTGINCGGGANQPTVTVTAVYAPPSPWPIMVGSPPTVDYWGFGQCSPYAADPCLMVGGTTTEQQPWDYSATTGPVALAAPSFKLLNYTGTQALNDVQISDNSGTAAIRQSGVVATFVIESGKGGTGGTPNTYNNVALTDCASINNGCGNTGTGQTYGNGLLTANIVVSGTGVVTATPTVGNNAGKDYRIGQRLTASPGGIAGLVLKVATLSTVDGPMSASAGAFSGQITSTVSTGTAPLVVSSTTNVTNLNASSLGGATFAAPGPIGSGTASTGAYTTLSASSTVSGTGFSAYLASPPAIGSTTPAAVKATTLTLTGAITAAVRTASSTTDSVSATTDYMVCADNSGGAATENLPASPATGLTFLIKDCGGSAATHSITITPASGNIDGASTSVLSTNYQSEAVTYTGSQWSIN